MIADRPPSRNATDQQAASPNNEALRLDLKESSNLWNESFLKAVNSTVLSEATNKGDPQGTMLGLTKTPTPTDCTSSDGGGKAACYSLSTSMLDKTQCSSTLNVSQFTLFDTPHLSRLAADTTALTAASENTNALAPASASTAMSSKSASKVGKQLSKQDLQLVLGFVQQSAHKAGKQLRHCKSQSTRSMEHALVFDWFIAAAKQMVSLMTTRHQKTFVRRLSDFVNAETVRTSLGLGEGE